MTELPSIKDRGPPLHKQPTALIHKKALPQTSDWILNADPTRGAVNVGCEVNASAWNSWTQAGVQGSG